MPQTNPDASDAALRTSAESHIARSDFVSAMRAADSISDALMCLQTRRQVKSAMQLRASTRLTLASDPAVKLAAELIRGCNV